MDLKELPEYADYWSNDSALGDQYVSSRMSRRRYESLSRYLHITDPNNENKEDKLCKARPFIDTLQDKFPKLFGPGPALSIDEAMIKYNGRIKWKQYMPKKPTKWGMKLWCLCDASTGYCLKFDVYTGRSDEDAPDKGLAYQVVMGLMEKFILSNHQLFCDNFFTSLDLVRDLKDADTYYCGTVRKNRKGLPKSIDEPRLAPGESVKMATDRDIIFCRWKDKRDVYLVSSNNDGSDTEKPRTRHRQDEMIQIPTMVVDYNKNMGGVDHLDQYRSYYNLGRAGKKWWKYLVFALLNIAVVNAYILWYSSRMPLPKNKRKWSLKTFKLRIVHQLADNFSSRKRKCSWEGREVQKVIERNIMPGHDLVRFDGRKRACQWCLKEKKRTASDRCVVSSFECSHCRVNLCRDGDCYVKFHGII
ncbi:hypothetical protein SNE40_015310 [Patella caerulea]|uniref:PiggyBac transposable element-derived protein domain-containing protein n=1 Tax=Patella caerulea TaxID=87958 RepID=A0AAN8PV03_PATCE